MSEISTRIREYVSDLSVSDHFGAWGALRPDQRRQIRELCDLCDDYEKIAEKVSLMLLNKQIADVVAVVRCKDCRKRYTQCFEKVLNDDDFCSYGERREQT
jgi:hypothetical protein